MRYELAPGFALRGSISNGFRAPSLHQQFFTTTSTNFINGLPVDSSTLAVNSPVARALGSRDLEPEKSVNLSLGATANPVRGLTFTVDYYKISIDNRIVLTENLGAAGAGTAAVNAAVRGLLDANGLQSVGAAGLFINRPAPPSRFANAPAPPGRRPDACDLGFRRMYDPELGSRTRAASRSRSAPKTCST